MACVTSHEALIALNMIEHVGPVRLRRLLEQFGEPAAILSASKRALLQVHGIGEEVAEAISNWEGAVDLGAGELLLTSVDHEGTQRGYEL